MDEGPTRDGPSPVTGFTPRLPWWGADLQTLRNKLRPPRVGDAPQPVRVELPLAWDAAGAAA